MAKKQRSPTNWARELLGCVDELADVAGSRAKARRLLDELGVPVIGDVFLREALEVAMRTQSFQAHEAPPESDPVRVLAEELFPYGITVADSVSRRSTTVWLDAPRTRLFGSDVGFDAELPDGGPLWVRVGREPTPARVYSTSTPRAGSPQFTVGGLNDERCPDLYFFVMLYGEQGVWSMNRRELRQIELQLRGAGRSKQSGFALHERREGSLRIWIPTTYAGDFELKHRIHTSRYKLVTPRRRGTS